MLLFNSSRTLSRQDLVDYISSHYKAPRMVLAAAGGNSILLTPSGDSLVACDPLNDLAFIRFLCRCEP